jgi:hypothetical protein
MKIHHLATGIAAPLLMFVAALSCHAQASTAPTTCADGTTSTATGRGACSGHGGVQKAATTAGAAAGASAGAATAPAATPPPASTSKSSSTAPATTAAKSAPAAATGTASSGNTDPTGATAKCKDGTYSKSQHHSGTCSSHGGVAQWLDGSH